ncbi:MAG: class I SAM-dependent methyltransferase [Gammaproteobacteria bacterium]
MGEEYYRDVYGGSSSSDRLYYSDDYKHEISRSRVATLKEYLAEGARILDVGSGRGHFVAACRAGGYDAWGIEASEAGCAYARSVLGLDTILAGYLPDERLHGEFDVATMWDVVEHLPDPAATLRAFASQIRPGGRAFIRTGNLRSWAFDKNRSGWWAWFCDHRFYFSPESLGHILNEVGFDVEAVLNLEKRERPDRTGKQGLSDTKIGNGVVAVMKSPSKLALVPRYLHEKWMRRRGLARYGETYFTPIMTIVARRR